MGVFAIHRRILEYDREHLIWAHKIHITRFGRRKYELILKDSFRLPVDLTSITAFIEMEVCWLGKVEVSR